MLDDLEKALKGATKDWAAAKKRSDRNDRISRSDWRRLQRAAAPATIKDAAWAVMEQAYLKASANNTLPANARQIMYAARPLVLARIGECWKNSSYFTQHLLPDYVAEEPRAWDWDVVFDARGHFHEPHTRHTVDLGTLAVRSYLNGWRRHPKYQDPVRLFEAHTRGPAHRFGAVLFIEKEGFNPLLSRARIAAKFDLAIMSTKGMSVTAARRLVEELSAADVTIYVARDFDKSGFSIAATLAGNTRRYRFSHTPNVIDLGLRLDDVEDLDPEPVDYGKSDPRYNLRRNGATDDEIDFLVDSGGSYRGWWGQRVELNAMASDQFVDWIETKLTEAGVVKTVPDDETLTASYRQAFLFAEVRKRLDELAIDLDDDLAVPDDLRQQIIERLAGDPLQSWDDAVAVIAGADHVDRENDDEDHDEDDGVV
jgi:hypothetical protein